MASQIIQPIETVWRGYRFRSRLEARWAVYFDALGVEWRYEAEGFVLPDGSQYLPDFYLPEFDEYVEIKGEHVSLPETPKVYMAGKMNHPFRRGAGKVEGDWDYIGPDDRKRFHYRPNLTSDLFVEIGGAVAGYSGPWAFKVRTSCHIDAHGSECGSPSEEPRKSVAQWCEWGIRAADAVVAYIDCNSAYGTLVELGFAHALGKPIILFVDHGPEPFGPPDEGSQDDGLYDATWFLQMFTGATVNNYTGAKDKALSEFRKWAGQELLKLQKFNAFAKSVEMRKPLQMALAGKKIYVFAGDPVAPQMWRSMDVGELQFPMFEDRELEDGYAAKKARSARFEFGQAPA